jgi:hypothetical protein
MLFFVVLLALASGCAVSASPPSCVAGQYLGATQNNCIRCPLGAYCPDGIQLIACEAGTYNDLYQQAKCRVCPQGMYTVRTRSTSCLKCPTGHSCVDRTQLPVPCPLGTYQDLFEQIKCRSCSKGYYNTEKKMVACIKCPQGRFCANPASAPIPCPIGQYNPFFAQTRCRECKTATHIGQIDCPDLWNNFFLSLITK